MNYSEKYTEEEWRIISYLPLGIGYLMGGAGNEGLFGSGSEKLIVSTLILAAWKEYPENNLIKNIITNPEDFKNFLENSKSHLDIFLALVKKENIITTEDLLKLILTDCEKALDIIKTKETQKDTDEYKSWLLDISLKVANESKEGSFLGFGGERFSQEEKRLYKKLELILK